MFTHSSLFVYSISLYSKGHQKITEQMQSFSKNLWMKFMLFEILSRVDWTARVKYAWPAFPRRFFTWRIWCHVSLPTRSTSSSLTCSVFVNSLATICGSAHRPSWKYWIGNHSVCGLDTLIDYLDLLFRECVGVYARPSSPSGLNS